MYRMTVVSENENNNASTMNSLLISESSRVGDGDVIDNTNMTQRTTRTAAATTTSLMSSLESSKMFFQTFAGATGTIPILIISTLVAFSMGSVVGIIPDVVSDRFARIRYHYHGPDCTTYDRLEKPDACQQGADDAQGAAAIATVALNILTLVFNPVVGSFSDCNGRRGVVLVSLMLYSLGSIVFVALQLFTWLSPSFYYIALSLSGAVDFLSMTFAAFSDVFDTEERAAAFGILLSGYYTGFTLSPSLPLILSHFHVSVFSCVSALLALFLALIFLPETLPESVKLENQRVHQLADSETTHRPARLPRSDSGSSYSSNDDGLLSQNIETQGNSRHRRWLVSVARTAIRPLRDMSILTRGNLPILAAGSFFSAMVYSSDKTLVLYYIEDQLNVRDKDLARMFLIFGSIGVIIQSLLLQPMIKFFGEKQLLVIAFVSGTCHNALYGLARNKSVILIALCLSQLTKVNFPILSSYASRGASAFEQGRVQGALFALNALANAAGPMLLEVVYNHTKNGQSIFGPGAMFLSASCIYGVGTILVSFLPKITTTDTSSAAATSSGEDGLCSSVAEIDEEISIREYVETADALQEPLLNTVS